MYFSVLLFSLLFVSELSLSYNPNFSDEIICDNLILNGDASLQGQHWSIKGHWARVVEPNNNLNYAFSLWKAEGKQNGFTQELKIEQELKGQQVTVGGWVKRKVSSQNSQGVPIIKVLFLSDSKDLIHFELIGKGTQSNWELLQRRITIPINASIAHIRLMAGSNEKSRTNAEWKAYFDNIFFTKCDQALPKPGTM